MKPHEPSTISTPMFFGLLAASVAGYGAYQADLANVPVLAPIQDAITGHLYAWVPWFQSLPSEAWFMVSGGLVGGAAFVVVAILSACFTGPGQGSNRMEGQLKKRSQRQKREHWAGFNS
jgi:hypothetical protein